MTFDKRKKEMDKLINSFILQAKKFTWYACFNYGLSTYIVSNEKTAHFTYDYDYFNFAKSTKSLISIRQLLKLNHNEDCFILVRSMFESYLAARYFSENSDKVDDFIFNPTMLALAHYNIKNGILVDRNKNEKGELINPSNFKLGNDRKYYNDLYAFLCLFAHANYGIANCYSNGHGGYDLEKDNYPIISRLFAIFTYTKLFEHVVTVEGEDFLDSNTEKKCYDLVKKSLKLQETIFDEVIQAHNNINDEFLKFKKKRMIKMFKAMKKSLNEELGSIKKLNNT